jgi:hypothetical protein
MTWRRADSNRRPPACKAGALPAELRPLLVVPATQEPWPSTPGLAMARQPGADILSWADQWGSGQGQLEASLRLSFGHFVFLASHDEHRLASLVRLPGDLYDPSASSA